MEIKTMENLARNWDAVTWTVISLEEPNPTLLRKLFDRTYKLLGKYNSEKYVPKQICDILLKMKEFSWWVSTLEETPLHYRYQELLSLVLELNKFFLTRDASTQLIEHLINEKLL